MLFVELVFIFREKGGTRANVHEVQGCLMAFTNIFHSNISRCVSLNLNHAKYSDTEFSEQSLNMLEMEKL